MEMSAATSGYWLPWKTAVPKPDIDVQQPPQNPGKCEGVGALNATCIRPSTVQTGDELLCRVA